MALGEVLGIERLEQVGKLTDAQIAMTNEQLTSDLTGKFNTALSSRGVKIRSGESLSVLFNRTMRKFKMSALTDAL
jgi:hypothetical protein